MSCAAVVAPCSSNVSSAPSVAGSAPSASLGCGIILRALVVIQDQIHELRSCAQLYSVAREAGDTRTFELVWARIVRAVELVYASYGRVRPPVIAFDGPEFGGVESFGELGLRAQMYIVEVQLRRLEGLFACPFDSRWSHLAPQLPAVAESIRVDLALATARWKPYRKTHVTTGSTIALTNEQRVARYHEEVLAAEQKHYLIAAEPRVENFLFAGTACVFSSEVQSACAMILHALQLRLMGIDAVMRSISGVSR